MALLIKNISDLPGLECILTRKEYILLSALIAKPDVIISRQEIANLLSCNRPLAECGDVIYGHVKNLRNKLRSAGYTVKVETVHDSGYKLIYQT